MALDPRLSSVELLALAALRVKQRAATALDQVVVLQIEYDAYVAEPLLGERYVLALPGKAPSIEAWYQSVARASGLRSRRRAGPGVRPSGAQVVDVSLSRLARPGPVPGPGVVVCAGACPLEPERAVARPVCAV